MPETSTISSNGTTSTHFSSGVTISERRTELGEEASGAGTCALLSSPLVQYVLGCCRDVLASGGQRKVVRIEEGGQRGEHLGHVLPCSGVLGEIIHAINDVVICSQTACLEAKSVTRRKGRGPESSLIR